MTVDIQEVVRSYTNQTTWQKDITFVGAHLQAATAENFLYALKEVSVSIRSRNFWGAYYLLSSCIVCPYLSNAMGAGNYEDFLLNVLVLAEQQDAPQKDISIFIKKLKEFTKRKKFKMRGTDTLIPLLEAVVKRFELEFL